MKKSLCLPILLAVNSPKDQHNEWVLLQHKKEQHQLQRSDVERLMYLNLILNGEYDEIDNYEKFLAAGDQ